MAATQYRVLTTLFGFFALQSSASARTRRWAWRSHRGRGGGDLGLIFVVNRAQQTLPKIASETIPKIVDYAESKNIELPFTDYASAKALLIQESKDQAANFGRYLKTAILQIAMFLVGLVVAVACSLSAVVGRRRTGKTRRQSLCHGGARTGDTRADVLSELFQSDRAQIVISAINTASLTAVFLLWNGFHYTTTLITLTFLCGLLPIIGNPHQQRFDRWWRSPPSRAWR